MKRLLMALVAIFAVGLGFGHVAAAIATQTPSAPICTYDRPHCDEPTSYRPPERGPPAWAAGRVSTCQRVDVGSRGSSPRPRVSSAADICIYDAATPLVQIDSVAGTADVGALGAKGRRSPLPAFGVAAEGATAARTTAVIGRQADTAVAKNWAGHEVLDLPASEWSLARNDQWVQSVIDRKMPVYVGSPTTWPNLWDAAAGRSTVFGRELQQFTNAGYTWDGWTMLPPGVG